MCIRDSGITDYIRRPFDSFIVQRRVKNTLTLYANQKRLMDMVSDQIYRCLLYTSRCV